MCVCVYRAVLCNIQVLYRAVFYIQDFDIQEEIRKWEYFFILVLERNWYEFHHSKIILAWNSERCVTWHIFLVIYLLFLFWFILLNTYLSSHTDEELSKHRSIFDLLVLICVRVCTASNIAQNHFFITVTHYYCSKPNVYLDYITYWVDFLGLSFSLIHYFDHYVIFNIWNDALFFNFINRSFSVIYVTLIIIIGT